MRQLQALPSQALLTFKVRIDLAFPIKLIVIISSQILENDSFLQDVIDRNQHGMRHCYISTLASTMRTDPGKLGMEITRLILYC